MILPIPYLDRAFDLIKPSDAFFDDFADRLNYHITGWILIFFAMMVGAKQFLGKPIQCYPADSAITSAQEEYIEDYCFVEGTYFLHEDTEFSTTAKLDATRINYYQWVPLFLAAQAFCFFVPHFIWKAMCSQSGINVQSILHQAREASSERDPKSRAKQVELLAHCMDDSLSTRGESKTSCLSCNFYITSLYVFVKLLYTVNLVLQFLVMNKFLGDPFGHFWGIDVVAELHRGNFWKETGYFPRVTFCDYKIRKLGDNSQPGSMQCVLMINLFNEKVYIFLWFWMFMVGIVTVLSLCYWIGQVTVPWAREKLIHRYLRISRHISKDKTELPILHRFCRNLLRPDGILLIRFIAASNGDRIAIELTDALWKEFRKPYVPDIQPVFGRKRLPDPGSIEILEPESEPVKFAKHPSISMNGSVDSGSRMRSMPRRNGDVFKQQSVDEKTRF